MPRFSFASLVALTLAALVVGCNVGPQPLPPGADITDPSDRNDSGGAGPVVGVADAGTSNPTPSADAGAGGLSDDGGRPGDAGDAGDAGAPVDAANDAGDGALARDP